MHRLGLAQYEQAFRENRIEAAVLSSLTTEDLKDLGVTLVGDRRRLLDAIAALRPGALTATDPGPPSEASSISASPSKFDGMRMKAIAASIEAKRNRSSTPKGNGGLGVYR